MWCIWLHRQAYLQGKLPLYADAKPVIREAESNNGYTIIIQS